MPPGSPSRKDKEVSAAGERVSRQTSAVSRFRVASTTESPTFKAVPLPELPGFSDGSTWGSEGLTTPDWGRASLEATGAPAGWAEADAGLQPRWTSLCAHTARVTQGGLSTGIRVD